MGIESGYLVPDARSAPHYFLDLKKREVSGEKPDHFTWDQGKQ
jgi:hypothetical protein